MTDFKSWTACWAHVTSAKPIYLHQVLFVTGVAIEAVPLHVIHLLSAKIRHIILTCWLQLLQQQDQLNAMSVLTAYLREAQAQQSQQQANSQPLSDSQSHILKPNDPSWPSAMSERQQLAYRSLSEAAVDQRFGRSSSDVVRATLHASAAFPGDIIQPQGNPLNHHLSAASTAGMSLAQQSLLYAPSQQNPGQHNVGQGLFQQHQFTQSYTPRHPFGSGRSSIEQGYRSSDPGRRPSFSHQDWMSTGSGPSRYSQESDFLSSGRRSSIGVATGLHNSFDLDWAGRPVNKHDAPSVGLTSCLLLLSHLCLYRLHYVPAMQCILSS